MTLVLAVSALRLWGEAELHAPNGGVKKQSVHIPGMSTTECLFAAHSLLTHLDHPLTMLTPSVCYPINRRPTLLS